MKTLVHKYFGQRLAVIVSLALIFGQQSTAQTYLNINFSNSTNKYALITEVTSVTFDESGGIVVKKSNNSVSMETLNLINSITLDGTSGGGTALPVELASFTGNTTKGFVELLWKTATELNNFGFEVERMSINTEQSILNGWGKVGFVEGHSTTNVPKEYSFSEKNLSAGKYSYRLKQIDRDGKFEYSKVVEVTITAAPAKFELAQNYPNPFNPTTAIGYQLSESGKTTLKVYDAIGREVVTLVNEVKETGSYSATFNASQFASGVYFARLTSNGKMQMRKLSLIK